MKEITGIMTTVVVTFVVNALLNFAAYNSRPERGTVIIAPETTLKDITYITIDTINYSSESIDGVKVSIPGNVALTLLTSTYPLNIEAIDDSVGTSSTQKIRVSGFESKQITRIIIPILYKEDKQYIKILNGYELNLVVISSENILSPMIRIVWQSIVTAILPSILFALAVIVIGLYSQRIKHSLEEERHNSGVLRNEINNVKKEMGNILVDHKNAHNAGLRIRVLLLSRISDYSKELNFRRGLVAKMILEAGGAKRDAENINRNVTEHLRTFSTNSRVAGDFQVINAAAGMLKRADQANNSME